MANVIIDQFGTDVRLVPVDDEHFTVDVEVAVSPQFFGWIISLGYSVEIYGPPNVLAKMENIVG